MVIPTGSVRSEFPSLQLGSRLLTFFLRQSNNSTLSVDNCAAAEAAPEDDPNAPNMQWLSIYAAPVAKRLNAFIPGLTLTATDANALMSLCGFDTAFQNGKASHWCGIFKKDEWADNEYYCDLEVCCGSIGRPRDFGALIRLCLVIEILWKFIWLTICQSSRQRLG